MMEHQPSLDRAIVRLIAVAQKGESKAIATSLPRLVEDERKKLEQEAKDSATAIHKGIQSTEALLAAIRCAAAEAPTGEVQLETDMRAHCNPTRMASIRQLSFRLVRRIATPCPSCQAPGWGLIDVLPGLPCGWCGQPTALIRAEIHGCVRCDHRQERPRRDGLRQADPGQCPFCNP